MNEITNNDNALYDSIREILLSARHRVYSAANAEMVQAYWSIGRCIVEYEQAGNVRAEYGKSVMQNLPKRLTAEFGKGFTIANLRNMRQRLGALVGKLDDLRQHLLRTVKPERCLMCRLACHLDRGYGAGKLHLRRHRDKGTRILRVDRIHPDNPDISRLARFIHRI